MSGVLVVDKPSGPTSHDVVARARRALRERRIGHTGTLDPLATGVLVLVLGRATRLARFLSAEEKEYLATVRFGVPTDTHDAAGTPLSEPWEGPLPGTSDIEEALGRFRGRYLQTPPAYSAKQVAGQRAYALARRAERPALPPVEVEVTRLDLEHVAAGEAVVLVRASAGFYVRVLAHELGIALGCGAHLAALRRVSSGAFTLDQAVRLEDLELDPEDALTRLVPIDALLAEVPAVVVTIEGHQRARHGNLLGPEHVAAPVAAEVLQQRPLRILSPGAALIAVVETGTGWPLHPGLVLD